MTRAFSIAAFVALTGLGWFFFELNQVWPFNQDRVFALRTVYAVFALAAACSFLLAHWRLLPPILLLAGFIATSAMSNAAFSAAYVMIAGFIVILSGLLSLRFRPSLNVR